MNKGRTLSIHVISSIENLSSLVIKRLMKDFDGKFSISNHSDMVVKGELPDQNLLLEKLRDCDILVGDQTLIEGRTLQKLPKIQWMQGTFDGVNTIFKSLDKKSPNPSCMLTRYTGNFGTHMAEYVLAYILAKERFIITLNEAQKKSLWYRDQITIPRLLNSLTIGVLGIGHIGTEICKQCSYHGMTTLGLVNSPRSGKDPFVTKYYTYEHFPEMLAACDYICSILPSTSKTSGLLDGEILSSCRKRPIFISVGRGDVISESCIINALDKGWISQAVLDVFAVEPLPKSSPLWLRDDVVITPHCSALTQPEIFVEEFIQNLILFLEDKPLPNVVNFDRGY